MSSLNLKGLWIPIEILSDKNVIYSYNTKKSCVSNSFKEKS